MVGRIGDRTTFEALRSSRRRARVGPINVVFAPGVGDRDARVAYAVGRKVGGAVVRNRLRRRLREVVRATDPSPGAYLVSAGPGALRISFEELRMTVETAMRRASGIRP